MPALYFILFMIFKLYLFIFNWQLLYSIGLISVINQHELIIGVYMSLPSWTSHHHKEFPVLPSIILILAFLFPKFWFSSIYGQNWLKKKKPIIENQWRYEHLYEMMGTRRKKWSFTEVGYLGVSNIWILVWCIKPLGVSLT